MKVIIGGAGITGLTLACYLQQNNTEFKIVEQSNTVSNNRSAIQISSNCHFVFEELGTLSDSRCVSGVLRFEPVSVGVVKKDTVGRV